MRHILIRVLVLAIAAPLVSCDAMLMRQSFVRVAPDSFPTCAVLALTQVGFKPALLTNSDGTKRLYVPYPHGDLNIKLAESARTQAQTVELKVIVLVGSEPSSQTETKLGEDLGKITSAIAKSCGDG
jgi:hypothetical protein